MGIERELKKGGIKVVEQLDSSSVFSIAKNVSKQIYRTYPNYEFSYEDLLNNLSNVSLYMADIPEGLSEASYYYKNTSIYFRNGMSIKDIEKYSVHEYIHHLQERKSNRGSLIRMGLCEFSGSKIIGMALNEAAVQIITSNIQDSLFDTVEYYGINFSTNSHTLYPVICNLVSQMAYITREDVLYESTLDANDHFKNKFIAMCNKKAYYKILENLDKILKHEEKTIVLSNILQNNDLKDKKREKIINKINIQKSQIRTLYFETQSLILTSYCDTMYKHLISIEDIDDFRKHLYNYQDLIGTSEENKSFNDFYINMMEKLDKRAEELTGNTYLVPRKESSFSRLINYIKALIEASKLDSDKEE